MSHSSMKVLHHHYIIGYTPTCVCPPGLPAQEADIQVGDAIIEVEGTDVTRASGELVINIIR